MKNFIRIDFSHLELDASYYSFESFISVIYDSFDTTSRCLL